MQEEIWSVAHIKFDACSRMLIVWQIYVTFPAVLNPLPLDLQIRYEIEVVLFNPNMISFFYT
jgi:hypothetical protein